MPLNPILKKIYEEHKKPPEQAPTDWALIEAAKVAKEQLSAIRKDLASKFYQLVQSPLDVRTALDKRMTEIEAEMVRLQEELAEAKADYLESETQWLEGKKSFEAIELYYKPQIISLETQASYVPLSQRATVSRRRKKPKKP